MEGSVASVLFGNTVRRMHLLMNGAHPVFQVIKLDDVTYVRRAKTAGMFHVALEVVAGPTTVIPISLSSYE